MDLSKNGLDDRCGGSVCELISESQSIKELVLDGNRFENTDFGREIMNGSVESISFNGNPLSPTVINSILDSVQVNHTVKSLGLKGIELGKQQENIEIHLAEVVSGSKLVYLGFDLSAAHEKALKLIENAVIFHNRSLIALDSTDISWGEINSKHLCFNIKKGLIANLWLSNGGTEEIIDDCFKEAQFTILKKIKNFSENDEKKKLENAKSPSTPQFKENSEKELSKMNSFSNSFLSEAKNFMMYSDSSLIEGKGIIVDERVKFNILAEVVETLYESIEKVNEKVRGFERVAKRQDLYLAECKSTEKKSQEELKKTVGMVQNQEKLWSAIGERLSKKEKEIEEFVGVYKVKFDEIQEAAKGWNKVVDHHNSSSEVGINIEKRLIQFSEKVANDVISTERFKEIERKMEKNKYQVKAKLNNFAEVFCKKSDLEAMAEQVFATSEQSKETADELKIICASLEKNSLAISDLKKIQTETQKNLLEHEKYLKNLESKNAFFEEKLANFLKFQEIMKNKDEDTKKKMGQVECMILELTEQYVNSTTDSELRKIQFKLSKIEALPEKLQKHDQEIGLISQSIQELTKQFQDFEKDQSLNLSIKDLIPEKFEKIEKIEKIEKNPAKLDFNYSKTISSRLEKLEKLNIHKKALDGQRYSEDHLFIPGKAENLVRSAVLQKAKKPNLHIGYKTVFPLSPQNLAFSSFEEDFQPSLELCESLKNRGISLNTSKF